MLQAPGSSAQLASWGAAVSTCDVRLCARVVSCLFRYTAMHGNGAGAAGSHCTHAAAGPPPPAPQHPTHTRPLPPAPGRSHEQTPRQVAAGAAGAAAASMAAAAEPVGGGAGAGAQRPDAGGVAASYEDASETAGASDTSEDAFGPPPGAGGKLSACLSLLENIRLTGREDGVDGHVAHAGRRRSSRTAAKPEMGASLQAREAEGANDGRHGKVASCKWHVRQHVDV